MKLIIKKGTTSKRIAIFIQSSAVTTGAGLTGLVFNTSSLSWYYWREDEGNANATAVTLATATRGTFASGGFVEKDATNMPGFYEIGIPDAALATGANWVVMILKGAANMAPLTLEIQLVNYDPNDGVRLGLTALPNAAANAAGGLPVSIAGSLDLDARLDAAVSSRLAPTVAGRTLDVSVGGEAGLDWANIGSPTTAQVLSNTTISTVTNSVGSVTGNVGGNLLGSVSGSVAGSVGSVTGNVGGNLVGNVNGNVVGTVGSVVGAVGSVTGNVGGNVVGTVASVVGAVGSVTGNVGGNVVGSVGSMVAAGAQAVADEFLDRNLAGGGSGNTRNVRNALRYNRNRVAIAAGTMTVYQENDATAAWTAAVTTTASNPITEIDPA